MENTAFFSRLSYTPPPKCHFSSSPHVAPNPWNSSSSAEKQTDKWRRESEINDDDDNDNGGDDDDNNNIDKVKICTCQENIFRHSKSLNIL